MTKMARTNQLTKYLSKLSIRDAKTFNCLSKDMDYNYCLKLIPIFDTFLISEQRDLSVKKEIILNRMTELEENYCTDVFLKESSLELYSKELNSIWTPSQETFSVNYDLSFLKLFSDARRVKLGIDSDFIKVVLEFNQLMIDSYVCDKFKNDLKSRLSRNNIKTWEDVADLTTLYCSYEYTIDLDYEEHWRKLLPLKNQEFSIKKDTYRIHFCDTASEMMSYGLKFKTCLSSIHKVKSMVNGEQATLIVFKNENLFSSLTIIRLVKGFGVDMMRTYNNQEIDKEVWKKIETKLKKLNK